METKPGPLKRPDGVLSSLNGAIDTLDVARDATDVKPAQDAFRSASILLTMIRVCFLPVQVGRLLTDARRIQSTKKLISSNQVSIVLKPVELSTEG